MNPIVESRALMRAARRNGAAPRLAGACSRASRRILRLGRGGVGVEPLGPAPACRSENPDGGRGEVDGCSGVRGQEEG